MLKKTVLILYIKQTHFFLENNPKNMKYVENIWGKYIQDFFSFFRSWEPNPGPGLPTQALDQWAKSPTPIYRIYFFEIFFYRDDFPKNIHFIPLHISYLFLRIFILQNNRQKKFSSDPSRRIFPRRRHVFSLGISLKRL